MKQIKNLMFMAMFLMTSAMFAQTITGVVVDESGPLSDAEVTVLGTTRGTVADFDGNFSIDVPSNSGTLQISYIGYETKTIPFSGGSQNLGTITLIEDASSLGEIVIVGSGLIDLAEDRKTPIAVSTVKASEIREKAGNWDLPEVLKSTPSVQNIKGGGFGDGQMYLRGFSQSNTAFLLNGQPINGMEDGKMYWSNWSGVMDIANAIQVQRGLGSSKLAISSVGGTVNIVTKTIQNREGGFLQQMVGNQNYTKTSAYYSTGKNEKGWSFGAMLGHWQGDGYVNHTGGQGQTYFFSVGYQPNEKHTFNFLLTGAPQWHAAAGRGTIDDFLVNGRRHNSWNYTGFNTSNELNSGVYPGGRNIYHKPVANVSWDWNINDTSTLSTVLYGSMGRGAFASVSRDPEFGERYARGSFNNHNWFGLVSNYNKEINENLNFNLGADIRTYNGIHFRAVNEFLGSVNSFDYTSAYNGTVTISDEYGTNPWDLLFRAPTEHNQRLDRDYEEVITYYGLFGQLEYSKDAFSAFFQGSVSNQDHDLTNTFNYIVETKADKVSNVGFNVKGGLAYEISDAHKVFANAGYYSRQPFHDNLYDNIRGSVDLINPAVENEKITGLELGYQFGSEKVSANLNVYHTTWDNRTINNNNGIDQDTAGYEGYQTQGVKQVHSGVELEVMTRPMDNLRVNGFVSLGNWEFDGNGTQRTFDADGNELGTATSVSLDGLKVGGAAQTTAGITADYEFLPRFSLDAGWNWYKNLYSIGSLTATPLELPSYDTVDAGLSYKLPVGKDKRNSVVLRYNMNNVFDEVYLESVNGTTPADSNPANNWKGLNRSNRARFGYGRTWNFSIRYNF